MKDPLGVSPSKGNQGTTRGKEKILLLHRADETQQGPNGCPRLQFLAFGLPPLLNHLGSHRETDSV